MMRLAPRPPATASARRPNTAPVSLAATGPAERAARSAGQNFLEMAIGGFHYRSVGEGSESQPAKTSAPFHGHESWTHPDTSDLPAMANVAVVNPAFVQTASARLRFIPDREFTPDVRFFQHTMVVPKAIPNTIAATEHMPFGKNFSATPRQTPAPSPILQSGRSHKSVDASRVRTTNHSPNPWSGRT